jgi:hypothetical protein
MDLYTARYFQGFAMRDSMGFHLGKNMKTPGLYILNTDSESGKGEHWCVVFFSEKGECEFFDPFGSPPSVYQFDRILSTPYSSVNIYNPFCMQDLFSKTCGHHCLFFAYFRCRGVSFSEILKCYDQADVKKNDKMVTDFIVQFGRVYYPMKDI